MNGSNLLGQMILKHWRTHHPKMLAELWSNHQLDQTLHETRERAGNLLYELIWVRKTDYEAAGEIVTRAAFPPSCELLRTPRSRPPNRL